MPRVARPAATESPAAQLAGFIAKFDPPVARVVRASRRALRRRFPTALELVYDNYNALAIGWAGTERTSDALVSIAAYARGVNLYFLHGASLPDPGGLLEGNGTRGRFIRVDDPSRFDDPAVEALLRAAAERAAPMPARGKGRVIIKSVSAAQRPRRPS